MTSSASVLNKRLFNPATYSLIYNVWFEDLPITATIPPLAKFARWFAFGSPEEKAAFDSTCITSFRDALTSVGPDHYTLPPIDDGGSAYDAELAHASKIAAPFARELADASEEAAADTALSLVLLFDQMPRNIFRRNQKVIYSHYDRISRSIVRHVLKTNPRADLHPKWRASPAYRMWFYLPLMHSEFIEDHRWFEELMSEMIQELESGGDAKAVEYVQKGFLDYEVKHMDMLSKFGRYPYRNEALGRPMTREEKEWLDAGGEVFQTKE